MTDSPAPRSELILSQTEDGRTRIDCRFEGELSVSHAERTVEEAV